MTLFQSQPELTVTLLFPQYESWFDSLVMRVHSPTRPSTRLVQPYFEGSYTHFSSGGHIDGDENITITFRTDESNEFEGFQFEIEPGEFPYDFC